jgi:hypothetical protein
LVLTSEARRLFTLVSNIDANWAGMPALVSAAIWSKAASTEMVPASLQVVSSVGAGASCAVAPGATTNAEPAVAAARIMVAAPRDTRLIFNVMRVAYPHPAGFFLSDQ